MTWHSHAQRTVAGTYSFANVPATAGVHVLAGAGTFGVSTFGMMTATSYGAPAAMMLRKVN